MKQSNQKLKLLYLMKFFLEKTDEEHPATIADMTVYLAKHDISAERKSLYDDVECLRLFGLDIVCEKRKQTFYYVASRDFELPELKLLVDSVQASKFITHKKSLELIEKLEGLTSANNAGKLHRQVHLVNRTKTANEQIYYNVDKLHDAIAKGRQIKFRYFSWTVSKEKSYRKNGEKYIENPVALTFDDENYYLITYKEKYQSYVHYRVDKMESIEICDTPAEIPKKDFDPALYTKKVFSMFAGEEKQLSLKCKNRLINVIIDRFGKDTHISKIDDDYFKAIMNIEVSPQFLGWILSFGDEAEILEPSEVRKEISDLVNSIKKLY